MMPMISTNVAKAVTIGSSMTFGVAWSTSKTSCRAKKVRGIHADEDLDFALYGRSFWQAQRTRRF
jgi:hypothetical protein